MLDVIRHGFEVDHIVERAFEPDSTVEVALDWPRRFDHMCAHTGHHLLSGLFETLYGLETLSWSLQPWPAPCFIEIPRKPTDDEMATVQRLVNEIIASNTPVRVDVTPPSAERPKTLPDDMPSGGVIRTVTIPKHGDGAHGHWDSVGCGGTQCVA